MTDDPHPDALIDRLRTRAADPDRRTDTGPSELSATIRTLALGDLHGVSRPQLQASLDEFVFRHNRRGNPHAAFQTLLGLGTNREPAPLLVVRGATDMPYFPIRE